MTALAACLSAVLIAGGALMVETPAAVAGKSKGLVACPAKVGPFKLDEIKVQGDSHQICDYHHDKKPGWAFLMVMWHPDETGERRRCTSRNPSFIIDDDGLGAELDSASLKVDASVSISDQAKMSVARAEKPLRQLIATAEALAHPCVPPAPASPAEGLACPLLLPHDLVRSDWYLGEPQVVAVLGDGSDDRFGLECKYQPAYVEDGDIVVVKLEWKEGDPGGTTLCSARVKEYYHSTKHQLGYHPVSVDISNEFVERWDGQPLADALVAAAAQRTQACPGAPEGSPPYASAALPTVDAVATEPDTGSVTETIILIGGGPSETPPAVGTNIELPEDDQHDLVVGGPDGEVIREEYVGSAGTISGYGPLVTDDEGNWSVMATIDVAAAPVTPAPSLIPSPGPTTEPVTPSADPSPRPSDPAAPASAAPAESTTSPPSAAPVSEPSPEPEPTREPTPVPPTGPPDEGAIRNVQDHIEVLGEMLDDTGSAEWTIPSGDIEALVVLKPDYAKSVTLGSGSIIVDSSVGKIYVTPIIGEDGLIEVRLSMLPWLQSSDIVRGLVRALNAGVADRGGRFRSIEVTPEGITLTAEGEQA